MYDIQNEIDFLGVGEAAVLVAFCCVDLPDKMQEEGQDRVVVDDGSGITQHSPCDVDKVSEPGWEIMLDALLSVPEQFMTGMGGKPVAGQPVVSADQAEQGFIWKPAR